MGAEQTHDLAFVDMHRYILHHLTANVRFLQMPNQQAVCLVSAGHYLAASSSDLGVSTARMRPLLLAGLTPPTSQSTVN